MVDSHRIVRPISPAAAYVGGKRLLAKHIVPLIEAVEHRQYAEPFVGMGGIFLKRTRAPKVEVINDASKDVATLFRVLQRHYAAFMEMMRFQLTVRSEFDRLARVDPDTLTDLERSARFLYLQRLSFGGKVSGRTFGVDAASSGSINMTRLEPILEALHERLAGVVIECLPYERFITAYDRADTLFYLDPPYFGTEGYYGKSMFERADFERLAALLGQINGRWIMSINDHPEVRRLFSVWQMSPLTLNYTVSRGKPSQAQELVITNVPDLLTRLTVPGDG